MSFRDSEIDFILFDKSLMESIEITHIEFFPLDLIIPE